MGSGKRGNEAFAFGGVAEKLQVAAGDAEGEDAADEGPEDVGVVGGAVVQDRGDDHDREHETREQQPPLQRQEVPDEEPEQEREPDELGGDRDRGDPDRGEPEQPPHRQAA